MFEYAKGRFVQLSRIITANVYTKEEKDQGGNSTGNQVIRVAIDLDVKESSKAVIYSDVMANYQDAVIFIGKLHAAQSKD